MHAFAPYQHHFVRTDSQRLHYLSAGHAQAETVVLLAGFPQSSFAWREVIPRLASRFQVIAPDLPGQGDSDFPPDGYDTDSVAQHIVALLDQLGIQRFHLVGHDIGAWVAWALAAGFRERVSSLALLDGGIPGVTLPDSLPVTGENAAKIWHFAFHGLNDLPEALIAGREAIYLEWFFNRKAANPHHINAAARREYLRIFQQPGALRAGLAFYRSFERSAEQNRQRAQKGKLEIPLLAVSADQGSIPDMATPLRAVAQQVYSENILNCGHFIPDEQPEKLAEILSLFFLRHPDKPERIN
ncbi:alpha/beta fold hydrolase [Pantoea anthophila]|uniref:alpha/beta fold hydrolase n=1 Tax=Pantoea anthophila TaxID=470931 RepID=UPI000614BF54|nr:alpha/beta hydrolase [Pantoea anthophila]KKB03112.1 hydrolase [Pantoea anthophila]